MRFFKRDYNSVYFNTMTDLIPIIEIFDKWKLKLIYSLKPSGRLLEIGCGDGRFLKKLQDNYSVAGFDISPSAINHASGLIKNKYLKVLDIEKESIIGKYDIILAFDLLEHLKDPKKAILKIRKALNKDGIFILSVPNNYGFYGRLSTKLFNFIDKTHVSAYERKSWIKMLEDSGFSLDIQDQTLIGILKSSIAKHFSFNLFIIARIK